MEYEIKSDRETASTTGPIDPRDIITNEDIAWSIAAAYAFLEEEKNEE